MGDVELLFRIRGDASLLGPDLAKASPIVKAEVAKLTSEVDGAAKSASESFRQQFGYVPTILRNTVSETGTATTQMAESAASAVIKPFTASQKALYSTQAASREAWASISKDIFSGKINLDNFTKEAVAGSGKFIGAISRDTEKLIAESKAAIAADEKLVAGLAKSYQTFDTQISGAEKQAASFTQQVATMAGPAAAAAAVIAAIGAAAIGTGVAIFRLVEHVAEAENKMHALSVETGFSVETLSALDVALRKNESDVNSVAAGLVAFNTHLSKSNTGTDTASKLLKSWNIDLSNNEKALAQVFTKLNSYADGGNKVALANALFAESGRDVLNVIKESEGNLDTYKKKLGETGDLMTGEMARSGHQFAQQMRDLDNQLSASARVFAQVLIPGIISALKSLTDWIQENKPTIVGMAVALEVLLNLTPKPGALIPTPEGLRMAGARGLLGSAKPEAPALPQSGKGPKPKKVHDDEGSPELQALEESNRAIVEAMRAGREAIKEEYDQGDRDRADYYDRARLELETATKGQLANIEAEKIIAQTRIKDAQKLKNELAKLTNEAKKIQDDSDKERRRLNAQEDKDELDAKVAQLKRMDEVQKFYEDKQLKVAEEQGKFGLITDEQIEDLRFEQRQAQMERRLEILNQERAAYGEYAKEYIELTHAIMLAEQQRASNEEENQRRIDTAKHIKDFGLGKIGSGKGPAGTDSLDDFNKQMDGLMGGLKAPGVSEYTDLFGKLGQTISDTFGLGKVQAQEFGEIVSGAFHQAASGFASMIQVWASGGSLGDQAMRKLVSGVLSGVAAMAATQAIYELALGFAAMTPWGAAIYGPAPLHFHAAALLGGIALTTAVLGRAFAPTQSNPAIAGTALRSASGNGSNSSTPQSIDVGRTKAQPQHIVLEVRSHDSHIVNVVRDNFRQKGIVRELIINGRAV